MDVPGEMLGVFVGFHDNGLVAPLEEVAASLPLGVVVVGVGAVDCCMILERLPEGVSRRR